jgi:hypothetical protein
LLGFAMPYSTRSQLSNVFWVCCWRPVRSIRRRTNLGRRFLTCDRADLRLTRLTSTTDDAPDFSGDWVICW